MARGKGSVNKVILIGNCGNDPEARQLPSGQQVVNISLATNEVWRERETNEMKERSEWHRVVFFAKLAETVNNYVRRGSKLYVEGSLRTRSWEQDGIKRYSTEIIADAMTMLDSKSSAGGAYPASGPPPAADQYGGAAPAANRPPRNNNESPDSGQQNDIDIEDDIPF